MVIISMMVMCYVTINLDVEYDNNIKEIYLAKALNITYENHVQHSPLAPFVRGKTSTGVREDIHIR